MTLHEAKDEPEEPQCAFIGQDECGRWIVMDREGLYGGVFVNRREAERFVRSEAEAHRLAPGNIVYVGLLEFGALRWAGAPRLQAA